MSRRPQGSGRGSRIECSGAINIEAPIAVMVEKEGQPDACMSGARKHGQPQKQKKHQLRHEARPMSETAMSH